MDELKKYQGKEYTPTKESLLRAREKLETNLAQMEEIVHQVSAKKGLLPQGGTNLLFYVGSLLYDYYSLVEECLLVAARVLDAWVPSSLDWHERLLKQLQAAIPERRPPLLSRETAALLLDYLYLHLHFHRRCTNLSFSGIEKMAENLEQLHQRLERELKLFAGFLEWMHPLRLN